MNRSLLTILGDLIRFKSVTPNDEGCQDYLISYLQNIGFNCQIINHDPVSNFFARIGNSSPLLVFAGHTDVVSAGEISQWHSNPFEMVQENDRLYGRGTADMKGSIAAMLSAAERFIANHPNFSGSLGFLITSGEEGEHYDLGTPLVMKTLYSQGTTIDYCIVGEPSCQERLGDMIKIGRRGSLNGQVVVTGKQGHVAYPHLALNPIHLISPVLHQLSNQVWDNGNDYFPPTSFQITSIEAGGHASNIIPGKLSLNFNFRFSTEQTSDSLKSKVDEIFKQLSLPYEINWRLSGNPFLTKQGLLVDCATASIKEQLGIIPEWSTTGGTSDGRFIAPYGIELIELGLVNATIHQVNEHTSLTDLLSLEQLYYQLCVRLLT